MKSAGLFSSCSPCAPVQTRGCAVETDMSHHSRRRLRHPHSPPRPRIQIISRLAAPSSSKAPRFLSLAIFALLLFLSECAAAAASHDRPRLLSLVRRGRGEIVYDRNHPPLEKRMPLLHPRDAVDGDDSAAAAASTTTTPPSTFLASSATYTAAVSTPTATTLPEPFDTSIGSNFTASSCPAFFNSFLANSTFDNCVPLSLLLQTSSSFFDDTRSLVRTTQVLDVSCNVDFQQCSSLMNYFATELTKDSNCGADYKAENPTVRQAYNGLVAYAPLYQAGCLKDSEGSYCFANAITNSSNPTDSYPYYLPIGITMPGGSRLTCSSCLRDTIHTFWTYTGNKTQPISNTYAAAASQVNIQCGPHFVNESVSTSSLAMPATPATSRALSLVVLVVSLLTIFL
ncbi:hypothetical protein IWZ00DRAFT_273895 [Phyllosticta capitalensis]|uniref:uncharacterized protein n=1 Tax=Phyllosticta capitalensis TaxID=121624 RepID=UPI00312D2F42